MKPNITIGSDPEMVILDSRNRTKEAYSLWEPRSKEFCGNGCYSEGERCKFVGENPYCGHGIGYAQIGTEGCMCELRPKPGNTPLEHVENIRRLLDLMDIKDEFKIIAGTYPKEMCAGGHIHIGMPIKDGGHDSLGRRFEHQKVANYLSFYLGIPLRKIEDPKDLKFRGLSMYGYGCYGNHHYKDYGIEFRMPASWMVTEEITISALCLAHVVGYEYLINPEDLPIKSGQYRQFIGKTNIDFIIKIIEKMEEYPKYRKEIEPLFQMISNHQIWPKDDNIFEHWRV